MNFFQSQDIARRKTKLLVFYFALAISCIIASVYLAFIAIFILGGKDNSNSFSNAGEIAWWQPEIFFAIAIATLLLVLGSSFGKILSLRSGGSGIATSLGGKLLHRDGANLKQTQLLNIVEEMAIASGMPVPAVYLLPEQGINAFAAGYTINDAVIGVTDGALEVLTRDELQGVIAHEFSHILNGDMRINIRLIGFIFGIVVLSIVGRMLLHSGGRTRRRSDKGGGGIALFGIALLVIGSIGSFMARLIKSAVSRQREFLADASAVQFTRNPEGIGGALKKILSLSHHGEITSSRASEVSHMFFTDYTSGFFSSLLATHPPLTERIRRIGIVVDESISDQDQLVESDSLIAGFASQGATKNLDNIKNSVGNLNQQKLALASQMVSQIPSSIKDKLSDSYFAQAMVIGLLADGELLEKESSLISDLRIDSNVTCELEDCRKFLSGIDPRIRLTLLDMLLPNLKQLNVVKYKMFRDAVFIVLKAKRNHRLFSPFDFVLVAILSHNLDVFFGLSSAKVKDDLSLSAASNSLSVLFKALVFFAESDGSNRVVLWDKINSRLSQQMPIPANFELDLEEFNSVLGQLMRLKPHDKEIVLDTCVESVLHDSVVRVEEVELIRTIAETLGSPVPLLVADASI